ncbi:hypothetical protein HMPREF1860_01982 [Prevotella amnii]|uniref:Uncharacterized protein n=1 Tax=Prevotella amnii TaxID=419005 RepID=A0A134B451_9BACT|nr:hypothetical protein HMPREF1860_01982 [Prevotella amnii]
MFFPFNANIQLQVPIYGFKHLNKVFPHVQSEHCGCKPKAVAGVGIVAKVLHSVAAGLVVEIDIARCTPVVIHRISEIALWHKVDRHIEAEHIQSFVGSAQYFFFDVHSSSNKV